MSKIISKEQLNNFKRDGYLKLESFFSVEEIKKISNWTTEVQNLKETPGKWMMYYEKSQSNPNSRIFLSIV